MTIGYHRKANIIINNSNIINNIKNAINISPSNTELFVVLKANGYGHGALQVAKDAEKAGADGFCVAILDEGLELVNHGFHEPILVLGITPEEYACIAVENNISLSVGSIDWLKNACKLLNNNNLHGKKLNIHLAIDTGMGRIGFQDRKSIISCIDFMNKNADVFNFEGLFTHFSTADNNDDYFNEQCSKFELITDHLMKKPKYVHVSNTATHFWHKMKKTNMVRLGIGTYGISPYKKRKTPYDLLPALSIKSQIVYVKKVLKGTRIGYGATYQAKRDEWIGTIPLGYADGIPRKMQGFHVLLDGNYCEIIGRICMDQLMIKLPKKVDVGTVITLIGTSSKNEISIDDVAEYAGTIPYEILCGLSDRLTRKYVE